MLYRGVDRHVVRFRRGPGGGGARAAGAPARRGCAEHVGSWLEVTRNRRKAGAGRAGLHPDHPEPDRAREHDPVRSYRRPPEPAGREPATAVTPRGRYPRRSRSPAPGGGRGAARAHAGVINKVPQRTAAAHPERNYTERARTRIARAYIPGALRYSRPRFRPQQ